MNFLQLWPLWLLISIPIIIFLYLLKQKAEEHPVSSLFLWKEVYRNNEVTTPWEKLKNNLLMYLQILAMLLLILALASPYLKNKGNEYKNIIMILDNSGSMNTLYSEKETRLEVAKQKAIDYLEKTHANVLITILSGSSDGEIVLSNSTDRMEIKKAIESIEQTDLSGDLSNSISLAESMTDQWESYEAIIFSDKGIDIKNLNGFIVDIGNQGKNAAIDYISHTENEDGTVAVLAKVSNRGQEEIKTDINLYLNSEIIDIKSVFLLPEESKILYFKNIPKEEGILKAELQEKDDLNEDNTAYDFTEAINAKKILLVTEKNIFLEKAILTKENIELYKTTNPEDIDKKDEYDLYIFDKKVPKVIPQNGNIIFIYPDIQKDSSLADLIKIKETIDGAKIETQKNAVTKFISSYSFIANHVSILEKPAWAESFLKAEKGCAGFIGNKEGRTIAVLGFNIHESSIPLETQFPILIHNLLQECLITDLISETQITAGDSITINVKSDIENFNVTYPNNRIENIPVSSLTSYFNHTEKAGLYQFSCKEKGEEKTAYLTVGFPTNEESDLVQDKIVTGTNKIQTVSADTVKGGTNLRIILLICALILLVIEWIIYKKQTIVRSKKRNRIIVAIRSILIVMIITSLFEFHFNIGKSKTTTVFLVDVSDSVSSYRTTIEETIKEAMKQLPSNNQTGVIAFGEDTRVEQFVTDKNIFSGIETTPVTTATNLEKAVQSAMAMFQENEGKRIVLLTDGQENEGSLRKMSSTLLSNQVAVKVMKLENKSEDEAYVANITLPEKVDIGDTFRVEVEIESNIKTSAILYLYSGNQLKTTEKIELQTGTNHFVFKDTQSESGFKSYRVVLEAQEDTISVNNEYVAFTEAKSRDKVLLIEGDKGKSDEFIKILQAANVDYERILPASAPKTILDFNIYKVIITLDVHADDLPKQFLANLEGYVKDYAGGFIAIGGENSFALGNYRNTSLEAVLPVYIDFKGEKEIPESDMALVIDHSGSMSEGNRYVTLLDLAKEAAVNALDSLRPIDKIGILSFDDTFDWVVPLMKADNREEIENGIYSISLGGGTSIYPALNAAYQELSESSAKIKHIILLTDGQDGFHDYDDLIQKINESGITLSTVAVGSEADTATLEMLANQGNGRYYYTDVNSDIPRIFSKEVFLSVNTYLINREFTPAVASNSEIIKEIMSKGLPTLLGYIGSSPKELATVHLISDTQDPILATWQYGLGKTAAFTSDAENRWTANYAGWDKYILLWKNLIKWCTTDTSGENNNVTIEHVDGKEHITYETTEFGEQTKVTGIYTDSDGKETQIKLEATAPGKFETEIKPKEIGVYSINIRQEENGKVKASRNSALALQYSNEYRFHENNTVLDDFLNDTNGDYVTEAAQFFQGEVPYKNQRKSLTNILLLLTILLFLFDIANRRLRISLPNIKKKAVKEKEQNQEVKQQQSYVKNTEKVKKVRQPTIEQTKKKTKEKKSSEILDTSILLNKKKNRNEK